MSDLSTERMEQEDTLHVGAARPDRLFGLPYPIAILLLFSAFMIQTNVGGWHGLSWAVVIVAPCWGFSYILVAHDPYGANVAMAWARTCVMLRDKKVWGGPSCSPLPKYTDKRRKP